MVFYLTYWVQIVLQAYTQKGYTFRYFLYVSFVLITPLYYIHIRLIIINGLKQKKGGYLILKDFIKCLLYLPLAGTVGLLDIIFLCHEKLPNYLIKIQDTWIGNIYPSAYLQIIRQTISLFCLYCISDLYFQNDLRLRERNLSLEQFLILLGMSLICNILQFTSNINDIYKYLKKKYFIQYKIIKD